MGRRGGGNEVGRSKRERGREADGEVRGGIRGEERAWGGGKE